MLLIKGRARDYGWRYELAFRLENDGAASAEDVKIALHFPAGSFVVGIADEDDDYDGFGDMEPPREPEPEWLKTYNILSGIGYQPSFPSLTAPASLAREPKPEGPLYDEEDRSRITYAHPKLWHQHAWPMPPVAAYIPPGSEGGFVIAYRIRADELPAPIEGKLNVVLERLKEVQKQ